MPKPQFCASDLERLKPKQGYWWVPCLFALASCSPAVVNSQYENRQLAEAIENLVPSNQPVSVRELPALNQTRRYVFSSPTEISLTAMIHWRRESTRY